MNAIKLIIITTMDTILKISRITLTINIIINLNQDTVNHIHKDHH